MATAVHLDVHDGLAIVTVDRPPVNALNSQLIADLTLTFEDLARRKDVGVIVLTGGGERAFVAGADIAEMADKSGLEMRRFSLLGGRLRGAVGRGPQRARAGV